MKMQEKELFNPCHACSCPGLPQTKNWGLHLAVQYVWLKCLSLLLVPAGIHISRRQDGKWRSQGCKQQHPCECGWPKQLNLLGYNSWLPATPSVYLQVLAEWQGWPELVTHLLIISSNFSSGRNIQGCHIQGWKNFKQWNQLFLRIDYLSFQNFVELIVKHNHFLSLSFFYFSFLFLKIFF